MVSLLLGLQYVRACVSVFSLWEVDGKGNTFCLASDMSQPDQVASTAPAVFPGGPENHQLSTFLELLIDVMYADVVLNDRCCRRVGATLVVQQETTLRALLATAADVFPEGLRKAISTYCVRHLLLRSPELMLTSANVSQALFQLADHLKASGASPGEEEGPLADIGKLIQEEVASLTQKLETKRYALLLDTLGDAIVGHMNLEADEVRAAADKKSEDETKLPPNPFVQKFLPIVDRFATAASQELKVRKRRREADLNRRADALLFAKDEEGRADQPQSVPAANGAPQKQLERSPGGGAACGQASLPQAGKAESFSQEVQASMTTPVCLEDLQFFRRRQPFTGRQAQPATPRRLAVDDSVQSRLAALHQSSDNDTLLRNSPAEIVVNDSHPCQTPAIEKRGKGKGPVTVAASEASVLAMIESPENGVPSGGQSPRAKGHTPAETCVLGTRDVVERSYFLCAATNRYEPVAARGFFAGE